MPPIRTQLRSYDFSSIGQVKFKPDLIELDTNPISLQHLVSNLDKIRYQIKQITGEDNWFDSVSTNLKSLINKTLSQDIDATWGFAARTQGLIISPLGLITDDLNGGIVVPDIIISNPLTKTNIIINGFDTLSDPLVENGYIYVDLPPNIIENTTTDVTIVNINPYDPISSDPYDQYPDQNRIILAQRIGTGKVWFRFDWIPSAYS